MKTTTDRMGGFISARIVAVQDIEVFQYGLLRCSIVLKNGREYNNLDIVKNGADAQVTSFTSKSGEIFNIDITIELKEQISTQVKSFNKFLAILEMPTGEAYVFGTTDFPLTINTAPRFGKTPAQSSGSIMKLTGKQPNNVLIL